MSDVVQPFEVHLPPYPPPGKFERERRAFHRLLPQLLNTHRGEYVAIHDERVVDRGAVRLEVALRVLQRIGNVPIYVGLVSEEPEPMSRSGVVRDLSQPGGRA